MNVNSDIQPLCFFSCWHHRYLGEFGGWGFSCFFFKDLCTKGLVILVGVSRLQVPKIRILKVCAAEFTPLR